MTTAPDLCVLIATRNRAASLERTLESMAAMDMHDIQWQLVVADNGSSDHTGEVLQTFSNRLPLQWRVVTEPGQNRARNRVLPDLRGRLTILTDDDVVVSKDWLHQWHQGMLRWPQAAMFGGTIVPRFPMGTPAWMSGLDFPFRAQCFAAFRPVQDEGYCARLPFGPNFAVRTALLQTHRFREDLGPTPGSYAVGGETELLQRLHDLGNEVVYLPAPCVEHVLSPASLALERLYQRGFDGGRGDEYRRAMRGPRSPGLLWLRRNVVLPLKQRFYATASSLPQSTTRRFRYAYKHHSTRGRIHQLDLMRSAVVGAAAP